MFTILVKIDGMDRRRRSTGLIHAIVGFYLILKSFDLYQYLLNRPWLSILPFVIVGALSLFYAFFRKRFDFTAKHNGNLRLLQTVTFFSFAILMVRLGKNLDYISLFIWGILTFILFFSEKTVFSDTLVTIHDKGILLPGSYREHLIEWSLLEDVVVRHDFITLFHRNKKYLQYQIMQDLSELELVKMNAFCREHLEYQINEQGISNDEVKEEGKENK